MSLSGFALRYKAIVVTFASHIAQILPNFLPIHASQLYRIGRFQYKTYACGKEFPMGMSLALAFPCPLPHISLSPCHVSCQCLECPHDLPPFRIQDCWPEEGRPEEGRLQGCRPDARRVAAGGT